MDHTELYEKTTMVRVEKTTGSDRTMLASHHPIDVTEACDDQETSKRVVSTAEPPSAPAAVPCSPTETQWLLSVTEKSDNKVSAYARQAKPKIQRVPVLLQQNHQKDTRLFKPDVVAIGPFHHGDERLKPMEEYKMAAARRFVAGTGHAIELCYDKVREVTGQARECYADMPPAVGEKEFAYMMFFDGCFLLSFIELYTCNESPTQLQMPPHLRSFVMKDMFLLENQIPLAVLKALMSLKPDDGVKLTVFIDKIIGTNVKHTKFIEKIIGINTFGCWKSPKKGSTTTTAAAAAAAAANKDVDPAGEACHLLDLLRTRFLGPLKEVERGYTGHVSLNDFRSGMELKEVGIKFKKSGTRNLRNVQFDQGFIRSRLWLPQLVVDDLTKSRFLNLIALEMCPDGGRSDYGITSYVWLMDRIIDNPEDVKELRSRGVLLNELGSDQQAADLFNELATDLSPDRRAYFKVIEGINNHYHNEYRVSLVKMMNTHFSSPWTAIAFFAGVFLTFLTVIQTVFTVWPRGQGDALPPAPSPPLPKIH